eukprot:jgi/Tetstr1/435019/TSEL_023990.t1
MAAISDWHRRHLSRMRLVERPAVIPCKDEGISALVSIVERRITRPAECRVYTRIPDFLPVSGSGAISYAELRAVRVLFDAEIISRYIRMHVDIDKTVDAGHECFAYIPDHLPCMAIRPLDTLEDYLRVFRGPPPPASPKQPLRKELLAAPKSILPRRPS